MLQGHIVLALHYSPRHWLIFLKALMTSSNDNDDDDDDDRPMNRELHLLAIK